MFKRNLTSRDFLKIQTCNALDNILTLTRQERYEQARFAQQVRNFWWTATPTEAIVIGTRDQVICISPRFSEPIIITDLLSMIDWRPPGLAPQFNNVSRFLLQITEYGERSEGQMYGQDFFGLAGPVGQEFITKYEKNTSLGNIGGVTTDVAPQSKWLSFVPRILYPYQTLKIQWTLNETSNTGASWTPQLGFRGVRVLLADNPYSYLSKLTDSQLRDYINGSEPETFFLELEIPFADLPGLLARRTYRTEQMDRPLLVLGAVTNLEGNNFGMLADLLDETEYYQFTSGDQRVVGHQTGPVPLALWCPDSDFRNTNMVNMWPVPHLLERGAVFRIILQRRLTATTRSNQAVRITFICRTV